MRSPSVLIVDDHPGFRAAVRDVLAGCGYLVVGEAVDGASAVVAAAELRPTVILLDIGLPDIDGFEVARQLLSTQDRPRLVFVSTREARDYGRRIGDSGAIGFITKSTLSAATLHAILHGATEVVAT
jgi:DNA-binding NarL/FixJ family response regulator